MKTFFVHYFEYYALYWKVHRINRNYVKLYVTFCEDVCLASTTVLFDYV